MQDDGRLLLDRALLIREPYLSFILMGKKRWELRGSRTSIRGPIGLIRSGSGLLVGECEIVACEGPLELETLQNSPNLSYEERRELAGEDHVPYVRKIDGTSKTFAWVLIKPKIFERPVPYRHPSGAITFVDIGKPGVLECSEVSPSKAHQQRRLF